MFDVNQIGNEILSWMQGIAAVVGAVMLVFYAFQLKGGQQSREKAKEGIRWVFVGMIIIFSATEIIQQIITWTN